MPHTIDPEMDAELRAVATTLESGGQMPLDEVAGLLRRAIIALDEESRPIYIDQVIHTGDDRLTSAIHMLHEQAHGDTAFRTCTAEPCRDLRIDPRGPAPRVLPA